MVRRKVGMGIQIMANGNWLLKRRNWYMEIGYRKSVNRKWVNKKRVIRKMEIGYRKGVIWEMEIGY